MVANLTFGFTEAEDAAAGRPLAPALVFPTFEAETVDSIEFGLKTDLMDGRARANIAVFSIHMKIFNFKLLTQIHIEAG